MACEVESQMTSVERVMAYSELPPEPGYNRHGRPPDDWPSRGVLNLHNVSMTYMDDGPRVLKDVNLNVNSKEKVGIVGRTGAGKSSIVAALLRMPDPKGKVLIDGVDLGTIDVQAARRSMAVITQDPVLFAGSVKKNLDPFERFSDLEIWKSLEGVQLKDRLNKLDKQLDFCVWGREGQVSVLVNVNYSVLLERCYKTVRSLYWTKQQPTLITRLIRSFNKPSEINLPTVPY